MSCAVALSALLSCRPQVGYKDPKLLSALTAATAAKLRALNPQDIVTISSASARLGHPLPARLLEALAQQSTAQASSFQAAALVGTLRALGTLGADVKALFQSATPVLLDRMEQLGPHDLVTLANILARRQRAHAQQHEQEQQHQDGREQQEQPRQQDMLLHALLAAVSRRSPDMSDRHLAQLARAAKQLGVTSASLPAAEGVS